MIPIEEVVSAERAASSPDFYRTQYEIITSPLIIGQVVDALRLYEEKTPQDESSPIWIINEVMSFPGRMINNLISTIRASSSAMIDTEEDSEDFE
jgi:uncharacterized protein involved in exopolysaccharide biosynthesis